MDVRLFDDARLFVGAATSFVAADPFSASVIAVHADGVVAGTRAHEPDDVWAVVADAGEVVGLGMHTPPYDPFLARMPSGAARALAGTFADGGRRISGVKGQSGAVAAFADAWRERTGRTSTVVRSMRMYRLAELVRPVGVPGRSRVASGDGDVELVAGWCRAFHDEAEPHAPIKDWPDSAQRLVATGQVRLWESDDGAVAMAAFSGPTGGVARVGPVYTPPERRRRGFGAVVTADATSAALATGACHVVLYTDLANPTSNAVYQAIGYRADHDAEERAFEP